MNFNNEYLILFDKKYNEDNFDLKNPLFFFLGNPSKYEIRVSNICAMCNVVKDETGLYIEKFTINEKASKGKKLKNLLKKPSKSISLYRNIIKKSDIYHLSSVFIDIKVFENDEMEIISKKEKLDEILLL